ncbi:MAG TPA: folate-binding protein, partial [Aestuariivirga sp.]
MNTYAIETLSNRAVIELRGVGVLSFLHNILTCSVENLIQGGLAYGALLSPQGKILHDVFIHQAAESVFLDCAVDQRDALIAKLKLYRLRAKFEIISRDDLHVVVGGEGALDIRHASLGSRMIADAAAMGEATAYNIRRFALGIADSDEIGSGKLFPHEANFDLLHAVDFAKGCYIGQEVVSRMQHRSLARSRVMALTFESDQPTDEIRNGGILL